jgi:hypothetical protein
VAGDAAVPDPDPKKLVAFTALQVELDLEGVGVPRRSSRALVATVASGHSTQYSAEPRAQVGPVVQLAAVLGSPLKVALARSIGIPPLGGIVASAVSGQGGEPGSVDNPRN